MAYSALHAEKDSLTKRFTSQDEPAVLRGQSHISGFVDLLAATITKSPSL
jgi:hypothetical protein